MTQQMRIMLANSLAGLYSRHCTFPAKYNEKTNEMEFPKAKLDLSKKVLFTKDVWDKMRIEISRECKKYYYNDNDMKGNC